MSSYLPDGCTQSALDRYHEGDCPPDDDLYCCAVCGTSDYWDHDAECSVEPRFRETLTLNSRGGTEPTVFVPDPDINF